MRKHIAPSDYLFIDENDKLRASFFDVVQNKMPHQLQRGCFQKRKEFLFPGHRIQRFVETCDMVLCNGRDYIVHDVL